MCSLQGGIGPSTWLCPRTYMQAFCNKGGRYGRLSKHGRERFPRVVSESTVMVVVVEQGTERNRNSPAGVGILY